MTETPTDGSRRWPVTAVTFDATGTLFHAPRLVAIYAEIFSRHDLEASQGEIGPAIRRVWQEMSCLSDGSHDRFSAFPGGPRAWWGRFVERVAEHLELPAPSPFAVAELFDRLGRGDAWDLYPETLPTLERLRAEGLSLAVVSNWDRRLERVIEGLGLADFMDAVVYSSAVGFEKPNRRIFEHALGKLGLAEWPRRAVHVGDRPRADVEGALAVGMRAVLVDRGGRHQAAVEGASRIASLDELPELLAAVRAAPTRPRA